MPHDCLDSAHVTDIATDIPELQAFRISGRLTGEDVAALSQHVRGIFERSDKIDMLIAFEAAQEPEIIPPYNYDAAKANAMTLKNLRNLAVVNAPAYMHTLLDAVDKVVPVAIRSFNSEDEALGWLRGAHKCRR